jgi:hypothetical protein
MLPSQGDAIVLIDFGNGIITRVAIIGRTNSVSPHTGAALEQLKVRTVISEKIHERLHPILERLNGDKTDTLTSLDDASREVLKKWKVVNWSYSYSEREARTAYNHVLELEQAEEVKIETLIVDGMPLKPYKYEETFDEHILEIETRVLMSEEESNQFLEKVVERGRAKAWYFPVIREGLNNTPREMRLGVFGWSKHEHGIKYDLLILDREYDTKSPGTDLETEIKINTQNMTAATAELLDHTLAMLVQKGLVSIEEVQALRELAEERRLHRRMELRRVDDVDELNY